MNQFTSNFKEKFNKILEAEKLNLTEIAFLCEFSPSVAYNYSSGRSTPPAENFAKIIKTFPKYAYYLLDMSIDKKEINTTNQIFL